MRIQEASLKTSLNFLQTCVKIDKTICVWESPENNVMIAMLVFDSYVSFWKYVIVPEKNVSTKFGHMSGLLMYVYIIHNCLNFSRNSAKNLEILLKNSILCSKLKYLASLMLVSTPEGQTLQVGIKQDKCIFYWLWFYYFLSTLMMASYSPPQIKLQLPRPLKELQILFDVEDKGTLAAGLSWYQCDKRSCWLLHTHPTTSNQQHPSGSGLAPS